MKKQTVIISFLVLGMTITVFLGLSGCKGDTQNASPDVSIDSIISNSSIYTPSSNANISSSVSMATNAASNSNSSMDEFFSVPSGAESDVQSMSKAMSSAMESLAALNSGTAPQLLEYLAAAETTNLTSLNAEYDVDFHLTAQGNTLIYTYKYLIDVTPDQIEQAESQASDFNTSQVQTFKAEGVTDVAIHDIYYDKNGNLIYERDYN